MDTETQGTWRGVYGTDGYILAAFTGSGASGADTCSLPGYISSYTVNGLDRWTWATNTSDPYDLQAPAGSSRSIGCWYTAASGSITLVPSQDGTFTLSVYLRDYESNGRWDNLSFSGAGLTGADSVECTSGKWIIYTVTATAGTDIVLSLQHQAGVNSTISALLFDPVTGNDTTPPGAVSDLAAGAATASTITLTWTAPADDGATGRAASYDIRYRTDGVVNEGNWASATQVTGEPVPAPAGAGESMVVGRLSPDTTYHFAVKARDRAGNIAAVSNSPGATTTVLGPSGQIALKRDPGLAVGGAIDPRFDSASVVTTTVQDALLYGAQQSRWYNGGTAGASAGGGVGASWVTYKYDLLPVPAYAHINLAQLRLKAAGGIGIPSMAMILTHDWIEGTTNYNYPGAAGGITYWAPIGYNTNFNQNPSGGASLPWGGWGPNSDSGLDMAIDGGPAINPASNSGGCIVYDVTAHVQSWVRGIRPNFGWVQLDYFRFSLSESGPDDQPVLFIDYTQEGDVTPPATIANLATSDVTNGSVTLSWTAPGDDGTSGTASAYEIRYARSPITAASWALATSATGVPGPQAAGTVQSIVIDDLLGGTTYYFAIKAADEVPNVTPISNVVSAQTLADSVPPGAVNNLAAGSATNHSLTLTWTAPGDDGAATRTAAAYDIRYSTSAINDGNWNAAAQATGEPAPAAPGTGQSMLIDNLDQNTTYYFALKTSDEVPNTSGLSNVASGQVLPDTTPPGAVASLAVTKTKSSALRLAWIASGDDGADRTASSYDVRYCTDAPLTEANWASATQVEGEPAAVQPGYHRNMWIYGLSPGTVYYIGVKAIDEAGNASPIAAASTTTPAASNLTRPLLQPSDFEFLGGFKLPQFACGMNTAYGQSGLALRRVNGNLRFFTGTHVYADGIYEFNFPGWGSDQSTWPQSQVVREWGMAVYNPVLKQQTGDWTAGLSYDQATGRLYYSSCNIYYVSQVNIPSLGCAVLDDAGPVVLGPWMSQNFSVQVMRGGSLAIPDWFADTYLGGRNLGVGFGGPWSGWASCSPGPALAAAHHPAPADTELDTLPLLQYDHDINHWARRDGGYWWRDGVPVYDTHLPDGDIGYWTAFDGCTGIWIDLPEKQGLLYLTQKGYGGQYYDYGSPDSERYENWWRVFDPADLAEVAQGNMNTWEPPHDEWKVQGIPDPVPPQNRPIVTGIAFDAQSRTLFALVVQVYRSGGQEAYPVVYGYRIKESFNICDINKDGHVDVVDLLYFVDAFGSVPGDPIWLPICDFNGDSGVDVIDLLILVENFGQ